MREPFPATRWTLLARAREEGDRGALARKEFAELYRRPVREFLLVIVRDPDVADELTQDFWLSAGIRENGQIRGDSVRWRFWLHSTVDTQGMDGDSGVAWVPGVSLRTGRRGQDTETMGAAKACSPRV